MAILLVNITFPVLQDDSLQQTMRNMYQKQDWQFPIRMLDLRS